ncbi:MAG: 7TM diverse intracellular signaling domain-containing protein, partial [Bacteroidota bacterium]
MFLDKAVFVADESEKLKCTFIFELRLTHYDQMSKKDKHLLLSLLFLLSCSSIYAQQEYAYSPSFINGLFVYYGVLIFTIVVTLAQFFISKDRAYFYYAFYVGTGMFLYGIWQEVDFNFLGIGERPAFRNFAFHGGMPALILGYAVYCKFSIEFLNLPKKNPSLASRFQRIIKYFLLIIIIDQ